MNLPGGRPDRGEVVSIDRPLGKLVSIPADISLPDDTASPDRFPSSPKFHRNPPMTRSSKYLIVAAVALLVVAAAAYIAIRTTSASGRSDDLTTDTHSRDLPEADKLPFLARYLTLHSNVAATDFHIRYRDFSHDWLPAPSEWDMRVVMKVAPDDISRWTADVALYDPAGGTHQNDDPSDLGWARELTSLNDRWRTTSTPKIYTRGSTVVAVFEPEAIVCKRALAY